MSTQDKEFNLWGTEIFDKVTLRPPHMSVIKAIYKAFLKAEEEKRQSLDFDEPIYLTDKEAFDVAVAAAHDWENKKHFFRLWSRGRTHKGDKCCDLVNEIIMSAQGYSLLIMEQSTKKTQLDLADMKTAQILMRIEKMEKELDNG